MSTPLPFDSLNALLATPGPFSRDLMAQWLKDWLRREQNRATEQDWQAAFRVAYEYHGVSTEVPTQTVTATPAGKALAGIRFFNRDLSQPFIELLAWSGVDPTAHFPFLAEQWSAFQPRRVRLIGGPDAPGERGVKDMAIFGASCSAIAAPARQGPISLMPVVDLEAALAMINETFDAMAASDEELARRVTPIDADGLAHCLANGSARLLRAGHETVGLIACVDDHIAFLRGQVIHEEVVLPAFQGHGFAALAQRLLAAELATADKDAVLLGTIDHGNLASKKSAAAAGRSAFLNYWFMSLE